MAPAGSAPPPGAPCRKQQVGQQEVTQKVDLEVHLLRTQESPETSCVFFQEPAVYSFPTPMFIFFLFNSCSLFVYTYLSVHISIIYVYIYICEYCTLSVDC